jgi:hypothetical protein
MTAICDVKFDLTNLLEAKFMDEMEHEEYPNVDL